MAQTQDIIKADQQRVSDLQGAALQFDRANQTPDKVRYWDETGHAQSEENWKRVHDEEDKMKAVADKLVGAGGRETAAAVTWDQMVGQSAAMSGAPLDGCLSATGVDAGQKL